ncbi:TPA: hypothetical protein NJ542_004584 [Vibrio parahaemolyticus]|nr:hypothetical protein [Vibrio parahaemolyticus]
MDITDNLDEVLGHCLKKSNAHSRLASSQKRLSLFLGASSAILSAIAGTSIFKGVDPKSAFYGLTIFATVLAALLTALQTALQPASEVKLHIEARKRYGKAIDKIQCVKVHLKLDPHSLKQSWIDEIYQLIQEARDIEPVIPNNVWDKLPEPRGSKT